LQFEVKTFLNVNARFPKFETLALYPLVTRPTHRFSFGGGFQLGFGNSELPNQIFFIPVQTEITPFSQTRNLALVLEVAPLFIEDDVFIRSMLGLRYHFGKTKDSSE
jgi:hypothetical protein